MEISKADIFRFFSLACPLGEELIQVLDKLKETDRTIVVSVNCSIQLIDLRFMHYEMVGTQFEFLQRYHSIFVQVYFTKLSNGKVNKFQIFNFINLKVFTH